MSEIILDMGSGNTCKNDLDIAFDMIDAVAKIDSGKHKVIFKWQLFEKLAPNVPLSHDVFHEAYLYAREKEYETTASVFDKYSLSFLLRFNVPFIKIACRPDLYWLIGEIPRKHKVYVSRTKKKMDIGEMDTKKIKNIMCIPKYPAKIEEYDDLIDWYYGWFEDDTGQIANKYISDHTVGWDLYNKYKPSIIEKHFVLDRDKDNPDSGLFAVLPKDLEEIL